MEKQGRKLAVTVIISLAALALFGCGEKETISPSPPENTSSGTIEQSAEPAKSIEQNSETPEEEPKQEPVIEEKAAAETLPEKFLLDMPFYSQAPLSNWDAFHEEMCEEASVLNAALYLEKKKLTKNQFEDELEKMQNSEKENIGEWKSTTVTQIKKLTDIYFGGALKTKIIDNPTIKQIEAEVAAGNPVIIPLAGRDIGNPNFTPPGPVYHMLVVKGYDAQNFITNDVGTRKGNSYAYKKSVIMNNIHDWNEKDIRLGAKKILVLYK